MEIDYEKKYEEALAKARAGKTLEEIFPEMNESEDERIREWLVDYFKAVERACIHWDISPERIISYLEKQKDASKAIEAIERIDKYIDEHVANAHDMNDSNPYKKYYRGWDDALAKMSGILQDVYSDEKQKEQKLTESISRLTVQGKGVYKICPRCKSRMIRDDSKVYTSMPPQYGYNCPKCGTMEFDTVMYDNPEMEEQKPAECGDEFIAEAEEYASKVNCGEYKVEVTEAYIAGALRANNKPAEWSEEDEKMLKWLCRIIHSRRVNGELSLAEESELGKWVDKWLDHGPRPKAEWSEKDENTIQDCIRYLSGQVVPLDIFSKERTERNLAERLKSLRPPQYCENCKLKRSVENWKPSEEQMEALDKALYYVPEEIGIPIAEIYGHFNKMKKKLK